MMQPIAVPGFVRPFLGVRTLLCLLFALGLFISVLGPSRVQASEAYFPSEEVDPQIDQLRQNLVKLQYQEVLISGLEKLLVADPSAASSDDNLNLPQIKNDLTNNIAKLELEIQQREKLARNFAVAEKVRAAPSAPDYKDDRYDRTGYSRSTISDCTWYAAEAVRLASDGRINLNDRNSGFGNWGNAGGWAAGAAVFAKNNPGGLITGVDKVPHPGDVMEWPDHVAFVERVHPVQDEQGKLIRYSLIISEEVATGVGRKDSTPVKPEDDQNGVVKRWRSTLDLDVKDGTEISANLKFIHFDY